jgi:8-oxo-dGTP pyrophosphatase MutT (NUDIX family)
MEKVYIDKLAFIELKEGKVLETLSYGKDKWYIPGGKRMDGETDQEALAREIKEELSVDLIPETIKYFGIFEAQAHGKSEEIFVRMICYTAKYSGVLAPASEIEKMDWFDYSRKYLTSPVDHLIFDDLKKRGLID